jgi:hypothetical protein
MSYLGASHQSEHWIRRTSRQCAASAMLRYIAANCAKPRFWLKKAVFRLQNKNRVFGSKTGG